ncbi:hypothetical protein [Flavobacterium laiguense]|uniref:DUF3300 domain-containing protein n=1 Tax=Flavobacterium laiguense TaxID=2169409 RepID=A0A2U1K2M8_9FLAO|nr:hypothetical protein [Flavobacterium laiguense]PWA11662.1 hypothetical protein DB891_02325 [Flavobacterium laiguense]
MKMRFITFLAIVLSLSSLTAFSQTEGSTGELGLPGDNLDLYAVLDLFQKSKTIEDFEKSLNDEKTKINNLDLNDDKKVDFIKVETKKDGDDFTFILRDPISKTETQDVAVILVSKDKNKKISLQIVGDKNLYGKDYIVEPTPKGSSGVTANPAYTGSDPVTVNVPASTTTVIVEQVPIVQYVYSPVYVPYYPPYYYGYYPPYYTAFAVMAVGIYRHNYYHYHGGGYGYHNTNVYVNHNSYNNYNNNSRNSSNTISHNNVNNNRNNASTRDGKRNNTSTRDANKPSASTRDVNKSSGSTRDASKASASTRDASKSSASSRPSTSNSMSSSRSSSSYNRSGNSSGGYRSGGGGGGYRGGGGGGGGGGRRR